MFMSEFPGWSVRHVLDSTGILTHPQPPPPLVIHMDWCVKEQSKDSMFLTHI